MRTLSSKFCWPNQRGTRASAFGFQSSSKTGYGALELAQKGTVFFKDISCLPNRQARLVRTLENQSFL